MDSNALAPPEQRLRVTFATDDRVKYVGHLDMARAWERAVRRSGIPLAYSHGFNPQPRIHFAAALPLGYTGEAELMDLFLTCAIEPDEAKRRLSGALPDGIQPLCIETVARDAPSLQSQVVQADYRVAVETPESDDEFRQRLREFSLREAVWRERRKGKDTVRYDLRPLVLDIAYSGRSEDFQTFEVQMRNEPGATGRPDELLAETGYGESARRIVRTRLHLAN